MLYLFNMYNYVWFILLLIIIFNIYICGTFSSLSICYEFFFLVYICVTFIATYVIYFLKLAVILSWLLIVT